MDDVEDQAMAGGGHQRAGVASAHITQQCWLPRGDGHVLPLQRHDGSVVRWNLWVGGLFPGEVLVVNPELHCVNLDSREGIRYRVLPAGEVFDGAGELSDGCEVPLLPGGPCIPQLCEGVEQRLVDHPN